MFTLIRCLTMLAAYVLAGVCQYETLAAARSVFYNLPDDVRRARRDAGQAPDHVPPLPYSPLRFRELVHRVWESGLDAGLYRDRNSRAHYLADAIIGRADDPE